MGSDSIFLGACIGWGGKAESDHISPLWCRPSF